MKPYKVKTKGKVYWHAWRGGPRIADPSTPEGAEQLCQLSADNAKPYVNTIGNIVAALKVFTSTICAERRCAGGIRRDGQLPTLRP